MGLTRNERDYIITDKLETVKNVTVVIGRDHRMVRASDKSGQRKYILVQPKNRKVCVNPLDHIQFGRGDRIFLENFSCSEDNIHSLNTTKVEALNPSYPLSQSGKSRAN